MHGIYELKDRLCDELEEYGKKGELDVGSLDVVDKLAHTVKNLQKIIKKYEEDEYSYADGMPDGGTYSMRGGYSNRRGSNGRNGNSYARRRDSMGRYSRGYSMAGGDMVQELRELMNEAPDERTRMEFQNFISKIENM